MCLFVGVCLATMPNSISLCSQIAPLCCGMSGEGKTKDTYLSIERYVSFCGAVALLLRECSRLVGASFFTA